MLCPYAQPVIRSMLGDCITERGARVHSLCNKSQTININHELLTVQLFVVSYEIIQGTRK